MPRHMGRHRDAAIGLHVLDEARIISLALDVSLTQVGSSELTTKPCLDF